MKELAEKIVELRVATRKACMCENADNNKKSTLSLKTKVLYFMSKGLAPKDIMLMLCIGKTNLASISSGLIRDNLIVKNRNPADKREISYCLTAKGKKYLNDCLARIEEIFKNVLTEDAQYADALKKIDDVLEIFSYIAF